MAKKSKKAKAAVETVEDLVQRLETATDPVEVEIIGGECMGPEYGSASTDPLAPVDAAIEGSVVAILEAVEGELASEIVVEPIASEPQVEAVKDFADVLAAVSSEDVDAKVSATCKALTERSDFETVKDPENKKIQKTLDSVWKQITTKRAARLMCAVNFDPESLNRVIHEGARYNVYAMGKLGDAIFGLTSDDKGMAGKVTNAINIACMKSLFRFRADGTQFTGEMAKAAASDKIRVDAKVKELLKSLGG